MSSEEQTEALYRKRPVVVLMPIVERSVVKRFRLSAEDPEPPMHGKLMRVGVQ